MFLNRKHHLRPRGLPFQAICPCCESALVSHLLWPTLPIRRALPPRPGATLALCNRRRGSLPSSRGLCVEMSRAGSSGGRQRSGCLIPAKRQPVLKRKDVFLSTQHASARERNRGVTGLCSESGHELLVLRPRLWHR